MSFSWKSCSFVSDAPPPTAPLTARNCCETRCRFQYSYLVDWIICFVVLFFDGILLDVVLPPTKRYMPKNDPMYSYPLLPDIVSVGDLMIIVFFLPPLIFGIVQIAVRNLTDFHHAMLGAFESLTFTMLTTDVTKILVGRYRPDFDERVIEGVSASQLRDGRLSFPSGHSSMTFAVMVFTSMYIVGKMGLLRKDAGAGPMWKALICGLPCCVSLLAAVSRLLDYHVRQPEHVIEWSRD
eukprot:TRINITY_DN6088_c0_g1_i2.p1 TRINITY_DN6088_c0_g1~~TRINITY_DN6088_c0_g1_i2.p1  ORF type:complete len:249 (+),score=38.87 TRINITY_DN6088_c0_g1_i2:34-747(+)